jgi:hypothetical protein
LTRSFGFKAAADLQEIPVVQIARAPPGGFRAGIADDHRAHNRALRICNNAGTSRSALLAGSWMILFYIPRHFEASFGNIASKQGTACWTP